MGKLLFLGDLFYDYDTISNDIEEISEWVKKNEYSVILNLEGPLSNNGNKKKKRGPNLLNSPFTIDVLKRLNVVGVCLANNHMMDYGEGGLKETLAILDANQILHTGAGMTITEAVKPMVLESEEQIITVQNFGWDIEETVYATNKSCGCAPRDEDLIVNQTKKLKSQETILVNVYHWGFEYNLYPMPWDIDLAHKSIDAGCDLIIGHHSHNIQPKETYKEKNIYYSLGNFYFASRRGSFNKRFPGKVKNMCDYGAAVVYDTVSRQSQEFIIFYNKEKNRSKLMEEWLPLYNKEENFTDVMPVIENITGLDFTHESYVKKAKEHSININPILTLDVKSNEQKLRKLQTAYIVANILRTFRKMPFGEKCYQSLKKIYFNSRNYYR